MCQGRDVESRRALWNLINLSDLLVDDPQTACWTE